MTLQWNPASVSANASQYGFEIQASTSFEAPLVTLTTKEIAGLDEQETIDLIAALQSALTTYGFTTVRTYTTSNEQSELADL